VNRARALRSVTLSEAILCAATCGRRAAPAGKRVPFQTREELLSRAHECARKRGLPVNLIAVDHYDVGDLIPAVDELNRQRIEAAGR
jgi:hypothetical protein